MRNYLKAEFMSFRYSLQLSNLLDEMESGRISCTRHTASIRNLIAYNDVSLFEGNKDREEGQDRAKSFFDFSQIAETYLIT